MESAISGPVLITLRSGRMKLKRPKKFSNGLTYCRFAELFARYLKLEFSKETRKTQFAPDHKVHTYLTDSIDWYALISYFEDRLGLRAIDTETWYFLGGGTEKINKGFFNIHLTLSAVFFILQESPTKDGRWLGKEKAEKVPRKPHYRFDPGTPIAEKVRFLVAQYIPAFKQDWESLPNSFRLELDLFSQNKLSFDLENLAKTDNFDFSEVVEDEYDAIFRKASPVVDDLIRLIRGCYTRDIA